MNIITQMNIEVKKKNAELTISDGEETHTVARHDDKSYTCSCRRHRISVAMGKPERCAHIYKAQRKGL